VGEFVGFGVVELDVVFVFGVFEWCVVVLY